MHKRTWWKQLHRPEYGADLLGTAFLLFAGLSAVVLDFGAGSPLARIIPEKSPRLLITGLLFAGSGSLVAVSPLGKLRGGHINPAVSLGFWVHGKMHPYDLAGYIAGQLLGALLGAGLLVLVWGEKASSVRNGMTLPGTKFLQLDARPFPIILCTEERFRRPFLYSSNGKETVKRLPWPGSLSTWIFPPCCSTMRWAIASPKPAPGWERAFSAR